MLFTNPLFFAFFAVVFSIHWILPWHGARKGFLLAASYIFYAAWDWRFVGLLWLSTALDYGVALALARITSASARKRLLVISLVANLGILGFFKYYNFFAASLRIAFEQYGIRLDDFTLNIVLPVGISFFTFQSMSYTIDVYRGRLKPVRNPIDFALYVAFFPQLVAGPIVRALSFLPQLVEPRVLSQVAFRPALTLFLVGFIKKACVADNLAPYVDAVFAAPSAYTPLSLWIATFAYAAQIYCDFSGYTDMAIASARMLGYEFTVNFHFPYFARNIADFWRRWHMSLSTWLRDYLYIPLGGNHGSKWFNYRNLMLTMLLGGLWHGAAWTFVAWGGLHGAFLIAHRVLRDRFPQSGAIPGALPAAASIVLTFLCVCAAWVVFRAAHLGDALAALQGMTFLGAAGTLTIDPRVLGVLAALGGVHWLAMHRVGAELWKRLPEPVFAAAYAAGWLAALPFVATEHTPFIYFQF